MTAALAVLILWCLVAAWAVRVWRRYRHDEPIDFDDGVF